ncbi:hypothetical protein GCM10010145_34430 [Streptomyces ruber]|uniref:Phosphoribosyl pyrophosphate synthase n=4 Tax=Streptomyces TaxID=1883 RepID=A0A918BDK0_9ACTN|nr:hypothetical protein GCM10010145_34430 [Streptomyces ruber]
MVSLRLPLPSALPGHRPRASTISWANRAPRALRAAVTRVVHNRALKTRDESPHGQYQAFHLLLQGPHPLFRLLGRVRGPSRPGDAGGARDRLVRGMHDRLRKTHAWPAASRLVRPRRLSYPPPSVTSAEDGREGRKGRRRRRSAAGRPAAVVDDMISTGATVEAAVRVLLARGAASDITVAAAHGLLVGDALDRLEQLPLRRLLVTDTLPTGRTRTLPLQGRPVAPLLADAIDRLHDNEPLDALLMRT